MEKKVKQLLILSGKGGTGKTTLASCFIDLLNTNIYADCDVEAPNLHLSLAQVEKGKSKSFIGLPKARLEISKCSGCNTCVSLCRFDAITMQEDNKPPMLDSMACEGCGTCAYFCKEKAIRMEDYVSGETQVFDMDPYFSTAKLRIGAGASGRLVSQVKKNLKEITPRDLWIKQDTVSVIDGSPGIGCPVIASISGVDLVLIVTEPTLSGKSDMIRILNTASHFRTRALVCINKFDLCKEITEEIEEYLCEQGIPIVGLIPYDPMVSRVMNEGKSLMQYQTKSAEEISKIVSRTLVELK